MIADTQAWGDFWRENAATGGGCAPNAPGITGATSRVWSEHAASLPALASVLDLATGNGAVLLHLRRTRPRARLVGIDSAPDLGPPPASGMTLMAGAEMEQLPFEDSSFDTVTSQFGFEYGRTDFIAGEVSRVLRPGGTLRVLIHHRGSPIVAQGEARRKELQWALAGGSPLEQGERFAAARTLAPLPVPADLRAAPHRAANLFSPRSAAAEIMTALVQILDMGGPGAPAMLQRLRRKAEAELARLEALIRAARDEAGIAGISAQLRQVNLAVEEAREVRETAGHHVFAWLLDARRD